MVAISDVFENLVEKHFNFRIRHIPTPRARLLHATGQSYHAPHSSKKKVKSSGPCFFHARNGERRIRRDRRGADQGPSNEALMSG
jgi:hypothetical protein